MQNKDNYDSLIDRVEEVRYDNKLSSVIISRSFITESNSGT